MKKLILKCALMLLILGGLLYAGGAAYKQTNAYRNLERKDDTEKFHAVPETIDIAVFGASHGREDFKFPPEGAVLFNFSMSLQMSTYDLRLMRQYQEHIRPGALVIMAISPMYPFYVPPDTLFSEQQPRYYRILSPENIVDVDMGLYLRTRFSPLLTEDYGSVLSAFLEEEPLIPTIDEESGRQQITAERAEERKYNVGIQQIAYIGGFPEENPGLMEAYRDMLALCRENGWNAVLVTPPYLKEYTDCFTEFAPDYFEVLQSCMDGLAREYDALYLDYSRHPDYTGRYDYYRDMSHMNLEGAEAFNQQLFADLQSLGLAE